MVVFLNNLSRGTSQGNQDLRGIEQRDTCDADGVGEVDSRVLVVGSWGLVSDPSLGLSVENGVGTRLV